MQSRVVLEQVPVPQLVPDPPAHVVPLLAQAPVHEVVVLEQ